MNKEQLIHELVFVADDYDMEIEIYHMVNVFAECHNLPTEALIRHIEEYGLDAACKLWELDSAEKIITQFRKYLESRIGIDVWRLTEKQKRRAILLSNIYRVLWFDVYGRGEPMEGLFERYRIRGWISLKLTEWICG